MNYIRVIHQYGNIAIQRWQKSTVGTATLQRDMELTVCHTSQWGFPHIYNHNHEHAPLQIPLICLNEEYTRYHPFQVYIGRNRLNQESHR